MAESLLFLHSKYEMVGIGGAEFLEAFDASRCDLIGQAGVDLCQELASLAVDGYEEWWSSAEFPDLDQLWRSPEDERYFRSALAEEDQTEPLEALDGVSKFRGLMALLGRWFLRGSLDDIEAALEEFNLAMEELRMLVDDGSFYFVQLRRPREIIRDLVPRWRKDEEFRSYEPLIDEVAHAAALEGWPQNDLQMGRALLLIDRWIQRLES